MKKLILMLALFLFWGCQNKENTATMPSHDALGKLVDTYYEEQLKLNPVNATVNGDNRYNDHLTFDFTDSHRAKLKDLYQKTLVQLEGIDRETLNDNDQLTFDILKRELNLNLKGLGFKDNYIPLNQFYGFHLTFAQLGSGSVIQPFKNVKDYDNWLKRMELGAVYLDSAQTYFKKGMANKFVLPKILVERMIGQLESFTTKDITKSTFYGPIANLPKNFSAEDKKRLTAAYTLVIQNQVIPAYERMGVFLKKEYLPVARTSSGISEVPDGQAYYNYLIETMTTTKKPAEEIYQMGLKEVKRIQSEMIRTKNSVGFKGDLPAFFEYMKNDPKFYPYQKPEEVLAAFHAIHKKMEPKLMEMFGTKPKTPFEIRQTEAFRAASASAEYFAGSEDGTRPGIFYVPILDAKSFNYSSGMESLFLHEAIPGHHYQISLQQENKSIPKYRRFGGNSAYAEGWALYTESLGKELGLYTDPYQYMGALGDEMHRAIRLVVDVGIHVKKMTREEAIDYMMANEQISLQGATAEIERYMVIPAQALSYKIGALKIREIREKVKTQLADKFNLAKFHDEILKDGNMPLEVLEAKMDRWAKKQ
ncbi:DUF885 domain-containing protein [Aquirufa ecclesiirivi]|uniref:DUF885 domain-containing protein n=1 Tax=Aquirufa ecclesiirivi TaxID=2715124 RepID=UPI00140AE707|nr:DUF885 domain-containing protein [Aquirufa ecclesiirivi]NHC49169.1 DUF885 domain-containing protein [Aquirufa ecclesiirivi]